MLFHIRWAIKNLLANSRRTAKKLGFMTLSLTMVLFCFAVLDGSDRQIKDSLYYAAGDLGAVSHQPGVDITAVQADMERMLEGKGTVFPECTLAGNFVGAGGYASGSLRGVKPEYLAYFSRSIGWNEAPQGQLQRGEVYLEANLAMQLFAKQGDSINIKIKTDDGRINADQFMVAGVFMGNPWFNVDLAVLHIEDMRTLVMQDTLTNSITAFYSERPEDSDLMDVKSELGIKYAQKARFSNRVDTESGFVSQIFGYYRIFLVFILSTIILTFIIILNFSLQNTYFTEFRSRRRELSTLLTFGMKPFTLLAVVIWETIFAFAAAAALAAVLLVIIKLVLGSIVITDLAKQQLVALLGGNTIALSFVPASVALALGVVAWFTIRASLKGAKTYLTMHIREIISAS